MLSKIKFVLWLLIILVVAFFVSMNSEPKISIKILPGYQTIPLPLSLIIISSIIIGALLILFMAISDWITFKLEEIKTKKKINSLQSQIDELKKKLEDCNKVLSECKDREKNLSENLKSFEKSNQSEDSQK